MNAKTAIAASSPWSQLPRAPESPTQRLDRLLHAGSAPLTGSLSPVSLSLAWADWAWHLAVSPGRQMELAGLAAQLAQDTLRVAAGATEDAPAGEADDDPRFRHPDWTQWPYNAVRNGFRNQEAFWREASHVPGMTAHHAQVTQHFARQWLGMLTPANWLPTNPVVLHDVVDTGGAHLMKGALNWWRYATGQPTPRCRPKQHASPSGATLPYARQGRLAQSADRADPQRAADGQGASGAGVHRAVLDHEVLHPRPVAAQLVAAALGGNGANGKKRELPPLATLTLLAAQTDFSEPGELGLFIDESQVGYLDEITRGQGYLSGEQMSGSFQFLHSRDLI